MRKLLTVLMVGGLTIWFAASSNIASADARLEERLIMLSSRLAALVQTKVRSLSDAEQQRLLATLLEAQRIINRGVNDPDDRPGDVYTDRVEIGPISRRSGGEIVTAALVSPVELKSLTVTLYTRAQQSRVRIMEAVAITDRGSQIVHELRGADLLNGDRKVVTQISRLGRVQRIEIRAEAWGNGQYLNVEAESTSRNLRFVGSRDPRPPQPPPRRSGRFYCTASCAQSNGSFDLRTSRGAWGEFELEAQDGARSAVRDSLTCYYGIVDGPCDQELREPAVCSASCSKSNGAVELSLLELGRGQSLLEAKQNARQAVTNAKSCYYGVVDSECTVGYRPTYCVAACANSNGSPNLSTSRGAQGDTDVEAKLNAITAVKEAHACYYGLVVERCDTR